MRRRGKTDSWIRPVAQLVCALVLLGLINPQVRQMISAAGMVLIGIGGLLIISLLGIGVYRLVTRSKCATTLSSDVGSDLPTVDAAPGTTSLLNTKELVSQLRTIDWFQFEKLVALVYRKLGYAVTRRGGANPDGGIDLVIEKDGQELALQCKQWRTWKVGVKPLREFLGALTDAGIQNGIFVTLCGYTSEAKQFAEKHRIEILNETQLTRILDLTNARFDPAAIEILRDRRKFCPKCDSEMVLRTAKNGVGAGRKFWGCSTFPNCRFIMPI